MMRLRGRNIIGVGSNETAAFLMHVNHDLKGRVNVLLKDGNEHFDHELHRRVVVVVKHHSEEFRLADLLFWSILYARFEARSRSLTHVSTVCIAARIRTSAAFSVRTARAGDSPCCRGLLRQSVGGRPCTVRCLSQDRGTGGRGQFSRLQRSDSARSSTDHSADRDAPTSRRRSCAYAATTLELQWPEVSCFVAAAAFEKIGLDLERYVPTAEIAVVDTVIEQHVAPARALTNLSQNDTGAFGLVEVDRRA